MHHSSSSSEVTSKEKRDGFGIPPPVTETGRGQAANTNTRSRRKSKLLQFAFLSAAVIATHLWWYKGATENSELLPSRPPHKHKKPLWGKAAEKAFLSVPNEESALAASRLFATKPHLAGSDGDLRTAKDFLKLLQTELGISTAADSGSELIFDAGSPQSRDATNSIPKTKKAKAWIDVYYPVMNTPLDRTLEVVDTKGKVVWKANVEEIADDADPASDYVEAVPAFHGLSASGDVQGTLIYANYGRKEDFDALIGKGVNLTGAVVICRYGAIFRGLKVKGAQELGAAGVLIYSDLRDDGMVTEENGYAAYPHGPARNINSVQRGSVQYLSKYPGDPTTPGYPAYENSTRTEGDNIPKIPSLPISAANAKKLMELAEEDGNEVHLVNHGDTKVTPIWNTMGVIPGHITDEVVAVGNHRDAQVLGATDPSSGTASVHEVIRGLGALLKTGWKPLRTILICSWDAEEYGLIGSTEWVEDFPQFIAKHVITYLNLGIVLLLTVSCLSSLADTSVSGSRLDISASPSLSHFLRRTALDLPHPTKPDLSLWDARSDTGPYTGDKLDFESRAISQESSMLADDIGITPLGSGSDYTAFLQMLGIASTTWKFTSAPGDAAYHYHSIFDSQRWQEVYADPGFHRHVAAAKYLGLKILRLSTAIVLPLNTTHYSYELGRYLDGIESMALDSNIAVDFSPLRKAITVLQAASRSLDFEKTAAEEDLRRIVRKWVKHRRATRRKLRKVYCRLKKIFGRKCHHKKHSDSDGGLDSLDVDILTGFAIHMGSDISEFNQALVRPRFPLEQLRKAVQRIRAVNEKLVGFEKGFISTDGIPDREWYKHLVIAPGKWLEGYGATPMPALAEAVQYEQNATLVQYEMGRLVELIDELVDNIRVAVDRPAFFGLERWNGPICNTIDQPDGKVVNLRDLLGVGICEVRRAFTFSKGRIDKFENMLPAGVPLYPEPFYVLVGQECPKKERGCGTREMQREDRELEETMGTLNFLHSYMTAIALKAEKNCCGKPWHPSCAIFRFPNNVYLFLAKYVPMFNTTSSKGGDIARSGSSILCQIKSYWLLSQYAFRRDRYFRPGKTLYVPKIDKATEGRMELLRIYDEADLESLPSGVWGIKEPESLRDGQARMSGKNQIIGFIGELIIYQLKTLV
ncbi:hypothetical protein C8F01DRAFT_1227625 [Mycena amicta]|nr:hypothetical protein C8F01DRAFT_1227625 [Mycena amicta]